MDITQIPDLAKFITTFGVGGGLALVIFWFYRKDSLEHTKMWQGQSDAMLRVIVDNTRAVTALQSTAASLTVTVEALRDDMDSRERDRLRERRP